jgi:hypothetical protein
MARRLPLKLNEKTALSPLAACDRILLVLVARDPNASITSAGGGRQDLHVLMAVVQTGSMSKAAVLLNTGQSAISRSIAELERAVGVPLLERNPRGVESREQDGGHVNSS